MLKTTLWMGVTILTFGLIAGAPKVALAQSDGTLGISCTVAGHEHCGENGSVWGRWHRWHLRHHH